MAVEEFRRGQYIISAETASRLAAEEIEKDDFGLRWGSVTLSSAVANTHFCAVGATRSGKTTLIRLLMQSVLPLIGTINKKKEFYEEKEFIEEPSKEEIEVYFKNKLAHELENDKIIDDYKTEVQRLEKEKEEIEKKNKEVEEFNKLLVESVYSRKINFKLIYTASIICFLFPVISNIFLQNYSKIPIGIFFKAVNFINIVETPMILSSGTVFLVTTSVIVYKKILISLKRKEKTVFIENKIPEPKIEKFQILYPTAKKVKKNVLIQPEYVGDSHRALIYDAKGDIVSILAGININNLLIMNPFDERSCSWDMAKDINSPASARQLATILIPEDKNASQPFFTNAARDLLAHVIISFIQSCKDKWSFRDIILALQNQNELKKVLELSPQSKVKIDLYFGEERTGRNIMSEIATRIAPFEIIAAVWSKAEKKISLKEWTETEQIIVLGSNEEHRAALDPINRVIFQRATELVLSQSESQTRRTWFFLDEVRDLGNIESLGRLMTRGASKGACVVLGFQDIEGMHDAFGKERANEFIGQCANKAILKLNSPETAKWASELFGKYEFVEEEEGTTEGKGTTKGTTVTEGHTKGETVSQGTSTGTSITQSTSSGWSSSANNAPGAVSTQNGRQGGNQVSEGITEQKTDSTAKQISTQTSTAEAISEAENWSKTINRKRMEKDAILPSQFTTLPVTNPRNGLHGYYIVPSVGAFRSVLQGVEIKNSLIPSDSQMPNYCPRDASEQYLQPWTPAERKSLGLDKTDSTTRASSPEFDGGVARFSSEKLRPSRTFER